MIYERNCLFLGDLCFQRFFLKLGRTFSTEDSSKCCLHPEVYVVLGAQEDFSQSIREQDGSTTINFQMLNLLASKKDFILHV